MTYQSKKQAIRDRVSEIVALTREVASTSPEMERVVSAHNAYLDAHKADPYGELASEKKANYVKARDDFAQSDIGRLSGAVIDLATILQLEDGK